MARASANLKIVPGPSSHRRGRDADKNVVPWKEMERRVAERIAAKAAGSRPIPTKSGRSDIPPWKRGAVEDDEEGEESTIEAAPDSGVRASEPKLDVSAFGAPARPLTFTVYSVEELDARQYVSLPPPSVPPPPPSRWPDAWRSAKALVRAWGAWYKTPKPRSRMMDVCGVPLATLRVDLFAAVMQLPWRKIFVRGGIALASFFFLMFLVLTAAELTDDMKPGSPHTSTSASASTSNGMITNALAAPKPAEPASAEDTIELEDSPVAKKAAVPAKKPAAAKKKPAGKKAPDIFNP